jgi:hypothetical protein
MNTYKEMFADYASEDLLQKRALGDELADAAHSAIEEIFAERGEHLPPRPAKPVFLADPVVPGTNALFTPTNMAFFFIAPALLAGAATLLMNAWVGVLAAVAVGLFFVAKWLHRRGMTSEQRAAGDLARKAERDNLSELMMSAANGDLARAKELVSFGADVNARSPSGTTALMYASRNNHAEVVRFLVSSGAHIKAALRNGSTASSIARKFGHDELATYLEQSSA